MQLKRDCDNFALYIYDITRFEKQILFLEANKEIDCLGTWAIEIKEDGSEYFRKKMPVTHQNCFDFFEKRNCFIHPTVMFRRSFFEKAGLYPLDTFFGEDTIMWMHGFSKGCKFSNIDEYLFKFRIDNNFFNRRRGWKYAKSIIDLRHRVNQTLNYGWKSNFYMISYATLRLCPKAVLDVAYRLFR